MKREVERRWGERSFKVICCGCCRVRQGRNGGEWRHVKEVMQSKGQRIVFVDGVTSIDDLARVKTNLIQGGVRTPPSRHHSPKSECLPSDRTLAGVSVYYSLIICGRIHGICHTSRDAVFRRSELPGHEIEAVHEPHNTFYRLKAHVCF